MACGKCADFRGDTTTHFGEFASIIIVTESTCTSMTEQGEAYCKYCQQEMEFDYDETLIPKLSVRFLEKNKSPEHIKP